MTFDEAVTFAKTYDPSMAHQIEYQLLADRVFVALLKHIHDEKRREWNATYNAALTGCYASGELHDAEYLDSAATAAANMRHGELKP